MVTLINILGIRNKISIATTTTIKTKQFILTGFGMAKWLACQLVVPGDCISNLSEGKNLQIFP